MGLFSGLFGSQAKHDPVEHAVIVMFSYGSTDLQALFALETQLEEAMLTAGVGEFDGNEIAADGSDGALYMYGPDADLLFSAIKPLLDECAFTRSARVVLRYGLPRDGVRERVHQLGG